MKTDAQVHARPIKSDSLGVEPGLRMWTLPGHSTVRLLPWAFVPEEKLGVVVGRELHPPTSSPYERI